MEYRRGVKSTVDGVYDFPSTPSRCFAVVRWERGHKTTLQQKHVWCIGQMQTNVTVISSMGTVCQFSCGTTKESSLLTQKMHSLGIASNTSQVLFF